ncbi:hypothetical protein G6F21_014761 [Rhizopus arrhizus]|nr:hypothetical protein G6F21_014761 [Rhizopus arrhizus]
MALVSDGAATLATNAVVPLGRLCGGCPAMPSAPCAPACTSPARSPCNGANLKRELPRSNNQSLMPPSR